MNIVVTHPLMTAKRYLNSNFLLDLCAVFPFELLLLIIPSGIFRPEWLHWAMYCRLNRSLQIYRIPLAFDFMARDIKVDTSTLLLIKYCIYFVIFITFVTCIPAIIECPPLVCATTDQGCCKFFSITEI